MTLPATQEMAGVERAANGLERVLGMTLIAAVLVNVTNVAARYVFDQSLTGVDEFQIYLMVALAFFGSVVAAVRGQHLRMDVLTRYFPRTMQRLAGTMEALLAVLLCGFVTWLSTSYALRVRAIGSVSENAHIPMWIPHSVVALAFAAMTVVALFHLLRHASLQAARTAADAEPNEVTP